MLPPPRLHPALRLILCAVGFILVSLFVTMAVGLAVVVSTPGGKVTTGDQAWTLVGAFFERNMLAVTLLTYPPLLLWLWVCRRLWDRRSFVSLGLRARSSVKDTLAGAFAGAALCCLLFAAIWLCGGVQLSSFVWSDEAASKGVARILATLWLYAVAFACVGFMEEVAFRGYLAHTLFAWFSSLGRWSWVVAQAAIFAAVHLNNVDKVASLRGIPSIFLIGSFFALCYLKTGSLWFPIGFHGAWNFILGCVLSGPVSGIKVFKLLDLKWTGAPWLTGGEFGLEGSLLLLPMLAVLVYFMARQPDHPQALLDLDLVRRRPAPEPAPAPEFDRPRFRTSMRGTERALDPDVVHVLHTLNQSRKSGFGVSSESTVSEGFAYTGEAPMTQAAAEEIAVSPAGDVAASLEQPLFEERAPAPVGGLHEPWLSAEPETQSTALPPTPPVQPPPRQSPVNRGPQSAEVAAPSPQPPAPAIAPKPDGALKPKKERPRW